MTGKAARLTAAAALAAALAVGGPARADDDGGVLPFAEDAMEQLLLTLETVIAAIPQYEVPEVLDNGDIVIRRVRPDDNGDGADDGMAEGKDI